MNYSIISSVVMSSGCGNFEAESFGGLQIDNEIEL
jgi:hypothetical protein